MSDFNFEYWWYWNKEWAIPAIIVLIIGIFLLTKYLLVWRTHLGPQLSEWGTVVEKDYSPDRDGYGTGVGVGTNGQAVVTTTSIHIDEEYSVVFKCKDHNSVFAIQNKKLYNELEEGDNVIIWYNEVFNQRNKLKSYNFVWAEKRKKR